MFLLRHGEVEFFQPLYPNPINTLF